MTDMTISADAHLREAENQLLYFRGRAAALAQHIIDRDQLLIETKRLADERDAELRARIAGLEDELRLARQQPVVIEEVIDAE